MHRSASSSTWWPDRSGRLRVPGPGPPALESPPPAVHREGNFDLATTGRLCVLRVRRTARRLRWRRHAVQLCTRASAEAGDFWPSKGVGTSLVSRAVSADPAEITTTTAVKML